ncbi:hypothetical protein SCLCIDRAFT_10939 [Scleroderma citrinum Foug A]|uniref:Uncharacterized protein n=1 Tax=Scleroderma citrinum Foug A TaxID=1036808 RepID=A0A0C2ZSU4_9AGAM|nr:hypothetical protein SCLCIDRAFT_10939 [Scleroderma citrinum Foug A]
MDSKTSEYMRQWNNTVMECKIAGQPVPCHYAEEYDTEVFVFKWHAALMSIADLVDEGERLGIDMPKLDGEMHAIFKRATSFYEQHRNKYDLLLRTMEDTGCHTSAGQPSKCTITSRPIGHMTTSKGPLLELEFHTKYLVLSFEGTTKKCDWLYKVSTCTTMQNPMK